MVAAHTMILPFGWRRHRQPHQVLSHLRVARIEIPRHRAALLLPQILRIRSQALQDLLPEGAVLVLHALGRALKALSQRSQRVGRGFQNVRLRLLVEGRHHGIQRGRRDGRLGEPFHEGVELRAQVASGFAPSVPAGRRELAVHSAEFQRLVGFCFRSDIVHQRAELRAVGPDRKDADRKRLVRRLTLEERPPRRVALDDPALHGQHAEAQFTMEELDEAGLGEEDRSFLVRLLSKQDDAAPFEHFLQRLKVGEVLVRRIAGADLDRLLAQKRYAGILLRGGDQEQQQDRLHGRYWKGCRPFFPDSEVQEFFAAAF
jgi:hypothetical protein